MVQLARIKAAKSNIDLTDRSPGEFTNLAKTIARTVVQDAVRKSSAKKRGADQRDEVEDLDAVAPAPGTQNDVLEHLLARDFVSKVAEVIVTFEQGGGMGRRIKSADKRQRKITVLLRRLEGVTNSEISEELGIVPSVVQEDFDFMCGVLERAIPELTDGSD